MGTASAKAAEEMVADERTFPFQKAAQRSGLSPASGQCHGLLFQKPLGRRHMSAAPPPRDVWSQAFRRHLHLDPSVSCLRVNMQVESV